MTLVKLVYFKSRGKYYTSGEYQTEKHSFHELLDEIRGFMAEGTLPGLVTGCREFTVFLESQEPWGVPHLFPVETRSDAADRLARAARCIDPLDAGTLRAVLHNWRSVEELRMLMPGRIADQLLCALDAVAIAQDLEERAKTADEVLPKAFGAPPRLSR